MRPENFGPYVNPYNSLDKITSRNVSSHRDSYLFTLRKFYQILIKITLARKLGVIIKFFISRKYIILIFLDKHIYIYIYIASRRFLYNQKKDILPLKKRTLAQ